MGLILQEENIIMLLNDETKDKAAVMLIEECSELIKECTKTIRGKDDINHVAEEMADVYCCMEVWRRKCGISWETINKVVDAKCERYKSRHDKR